jgi:mannose-6-phosphate isomerase-like protein (cupin superfamily)
LKRLSTIALVLEDANVETEARLTRHHDVILTLARLSSARAEAAVPAGSAQFVVGEATAALPLGDVIDLPKERARLEKEMKKADEEIARIHAKLSNQAFVAKAPEDVIEEQKERRAEAQALRARLSDALTRLSVYEEIMTKLPEDPPPPVVVMPGEGETYHVGPSTVVRKIGGEHTDGHFGIVEYTVAPHFVAPTVWHWHTKDGWVLYVISGAISVALPAKTVEIPAGGFMTLQAGAPFAWSNPGDAPAKLLFVYMPAGFENYFREATAVMTANPGVAAKDLGPQLLPLWEKYGIASEG